MDSLPPEKHLSSAREYLHLALLGQRAATEELQANNHELAAILEEFFSVRGELRAAAGQFADGDGYSRHSEAVEPRPAAKYLDLDQLQAEAEQALQISRRAVHESALLREASKRVRAALLASANGGGARITDTDHGGLSKRERQVLTLIVSGKSSKQIAVELGISFKTAVTHRASIMGKLDVHEIASVVREALRRGLV